MRILGIDPGLANLGWAVAEYERGQVTMLAAGVLRTKATHKGKRVELGVSKAGDKLRRVDEIAGFLLHLLAEWGPQAICHEDVSLGFHQALTLFDMGLSFGILRTAAVSRALPLVALRPVEIKTALALDPKAEKEEMIARVLDRFPELAPHLPLARLSWEHLADAAAAAAAGAPRALEAVVGPASCAL